MQQKTMSSNINEASRGFLFLLRKISHAQKAQKA